MSRWPSGVLRGNDEQLDARHCSWYQVRFNGDVVGVLLQGGPDVDVVGHQASLSSTGRVPDLIMSSSRRFSARCSAVNGGSFPRQRALPSSVLLHPAAFNIASLTAARFMWPRTASATVAEAFSLPSRYAATSSGRLTVIRLVIPGSYRGSVPSTPLPRRGQR